MVQVSSPLVKTQLVRIPPLENGDRLSRDEFEKRYAEWPDSRAELIEGIVYMAAALRFRSHGKPHSQLNGWLLVYQALMPGTELGDAPSVRLDLGNEPQPDLVLIWDADRGGQTRITEDDYIEGAPEFIAEISASTVSIDLGAKKIAYERNGVQEYLVWRVLDQEIDWFWLEDDRYSLLQADSDGITRSRIFPGLWLDRSALLRGEMNRVLEVVRKGVAEIQK
ncbi:MAG: Uma2 family endonuclease [Alkalinema sp. CAN_BIN05]|nr:Uma2 family endonuclease [Alkalinema sp. CAN_BIN05]